MLSETLPKTWFDAHFHFIQTEKGIRRRMALPSHADVIATIDKLLDEYAILQKRARYDDLSDLPRESVTLAVRLAAGMERLHLKATAYGRETDLVADEPPHIRIPVYIGVLHALKADISDGWVEGLAELVHADTFSDLLDQAGELLAKSYKDAASVITGSVLEAHIRLLCLKFGVSTLQASGLPKKAESMNIDLVKANAYNLLEQKSVTAWLGIRNASAHGEYGKYDRNQVANMNQAVRDFLVRHPA